MASHIMPKLQLQPLDLMNKLAILRSDPTHAQNVLADLDNDIKNGYLPRKAELEKFLRVGHHFRLTRSQVLILHTKIIMAARRQAQLILDSILNSGENQLALS